jgi:hypothetical protein
MKKIFFTILVIFYSNTLNAQESYLCISEAIGGVAYDSSLNKWDGTKFSNNNHKIILKKKNGSWKYADFGNNFEESCDKMNEYGIFRCNMILGEFIFNSKSKRFIKTYTAGYLSGQDNNDNTPYVMIGTCSPL